MPINGTDFIKSPWDTMLSPFTDLLGTGFYLIPVTFIAIALFMKTRDVMVASVWLLASGIMLSGGSIFTGYLEMSLVYTIVVAAGITGIVISIISMRK